MLPIVYGNHRSSIRGGSSIHLVTQYQILHIAPQSPAETLFAIICFGIPLIYAAQFPYWLMRWIFGWQLIDGSKPSKQKKIGLKDMLTMMAALAVSAVAATQGTSMFNPTINDSVEIGDTKCEAITDPATGGNNLG